MLLFSIFKIIFPKVISEIICKFIREDTLVTFQTFRIYKNMRIQSLYKLSYYLADII